MMYAGLNLVEKDGKFYFEDSALAETHDRRGMRRDLYQAFLEKHNLKESNSSSNPEWGIMIPKEHRPLFRRKRTNSFRNIGQLEFMTYALTDHDGLLTKNRQYVYTFQPYDLKLETYKMIEEVWGAWGLFVDISYKDAWWYPGRTPLVIISQFEIKLEKG